MTTKEILTAAKNTCNELAHTSSEQRTTALRKMADSIMSDMDIILEANKKDMELSKSSISLAMQDRLALNKERIAAMADGIYKTSMLPDPIGKILKSFHHQNGLIINKISVPIGVIAIIYESRPNVTSDAAALAVKSGNVCVLRSGKEAFNSANAIVSAMKKGLAESGLSENCINLIQDTSRQSSIELMTANGLVDLLIPRGGASLINACISNATVPCIQTGTGICHIYVDKDADFEMALNVIENAKTSRPSVCNAAEVCLIHKEIAYEFLPKLKKRLTDEQIVVGKQPVELRVDKFSENIIGGIPASEEDYNTEFLNYILAIKTVKDIDDAVQHISTHSSGHSEAIITSNQSAAAFFTSSVDSSAVYINASTRFTDGGEFGLGCEMGISTQKLHARGPLGLEELTTYKYVIYGNGQIR